MVTLLLNAGADANSSLPEGETALMTASRTGNVDVVNTLIGHGADVNAKENWRDQTALMWAAAEGHTTVVKALIAHGAELNARSNGKSAVSTSGYRYGEGAFTALLFASRQGQLDVVRALIESGANVNDRVRLNTVEQPADGDHRPDGPYGSSALVLAIGSGHFDVAAFLLDKGADPNADAQGWTALHEITWIRKAGIGDNLPAPAAVSNLSSLDMVRILVKHGANVNARTKPSGEDYLRRVVKTDLVSSGSTPFLLAARTADVELMRLLVELGADPRRANDDGTTPLLAAAGVGTQAPGEDPGTDSEALQAVQFALQLGGDVNAIDKNGESALHGAAYKQLPLVVRFLAGKGAKPEVWNRKDRYGWTPLMIAEGVQRVNNIRSSPATAEAIRAALAAATPTTTSRSNPNQREPGHFTMEFVKIAPGEFTMGCSTGDADCLGDEQPPHAVRITKPFEIGKYEVTQEQWQDVMGNNPSHFKGADRPVESISWNEVQQFMQKLNARNDGYRYRLPSEAEWEYAARAGTTGKYYAASLDDIAWYGNNSGDRPIDAKKIWDTDRTNYVRRIGNNRDQTHSVGQKKPNPWGIYDIEGNVLEWVQDYYDDQYYRSSPAADPPGPASGQFRVVRGGSWSYNAVFARVSHRALVEPDSSNLLIGFRCVREPMQ
jgi:formylglycine-generating enzyme required for sulfatase activity